LKRRAELVTLAEAQAFVTGRYDTSAHRFRVLMTFDDGYLDNYKLAFPVLRSHSVHGVFFLATTLVGSCLVPWWDYIAYVIKTSRQRLFSLRYPAQLTLDLVENGFAKTLRDVLHLYKKPENVEPDRFIQELVCAANGDVPPGHLRRFLDWDEARQM